jgi:hypothetical protein
MVLVILPRRGTGGQAARTRVDRRAVPVKRNVAEDRHGVELVVMLVDVAVVMLELSAVEVRRKDEADLVLRIEDMYLDQMTVGPVMCGVRRRGV